MHTHLVRCTMRTLYATTCGTAAWLLSGCLSSSTEPTTVSRLEGQWDVSGQSAAGVAIGVQGGLVVRSGAGAGFTGAYDVIESSAQGAQRRVSGPVSGRTAGISSVEFEVVLGAVVRRHVATQTADTVRGSWFDVSQGGAVEASGTFRAVRR